MHRPLQPLPERGVVPTSRHLDSSASQASNPTTGRKSGHVRPHPARPIYKRIDAAYYINKRITFCTISKYCVVNIVVRCCRYPVKTCHRNHQHSALIVELLDLLTSYANDAVNSQAVNNADDTWPHIALVENRLRLVRYCSKFNIVFIFYHIYSL